MIKPLLVLTFTLTSCLAHRPWLPENQAVVNSCLDSGGCWNFQTNTCERVDPKRCPTPQVQP